jgi:hypothetical protein
LLSWGAGWLVRKWWKEGESEWLRSHVAGVGLHAAPCRLQQPFVFSCPCAISAMYAITRSTCSFGFGLLPKYMDGDSAVTSIRLAKFDVNLQVMAATRNAPG